jgi:cyclopropane-fatty-acyl-phospholipid synthase
VWSPGQLGLGRANVAGDLDLDGDVFTVLERLRGAVPPELRFGLPVVPSLLRAARQLGVLGDTDRHGHSGMSSTRRGWN